MILDKIKFKTLETFEFDVIAKESTQDMNKFICAYFFEDSVGLIANKA